MKPDDKAPELPDSIGSSPASDDAPEVTLLAGMKVLFDEKVGLAPAQVVDRNGATNGQRRAGNGYAHG